MAVEVVVTGGDTDLGRTVAEGFRDEGHKITLVGARGSDLEVVAKELDVDAIVCDTTDPASLERGPGAVPPSPGHHRQHPGTDLGRRRSPHLLAVRHRHRVAQDARRDAALGGADRAVRG